jgi:hypothetical protein
MKLSILLIAPIFLFSCKKRESKEHRKYEFSPKIIKRIHTIMTSHEIEGYTHYLTMENYDEGSNNFFVEYADKYRDTCKTDLPIWSITFCTPFNFEPHYDLRDDEPLRVHSIMTIGYQEETLHKEYPNIESVTFYKEGKSIYVQTMTLERMRNGGYYDSIGRYDHKWIKEFDQKFKTQFSDSIK